MRARRQARNLAALGAALLFPLQAAAAGLALPGELPELQLHGFISQGYLLSSSNNYLADTSRGSFDFSEVGLNATLPATDRLRLGLQLFSRKLGPLGDYRPVFDWYYLDYHWRDWLGVRAGRVKLPFGLYNDTSDIDAARTAILLPQSVYPAQNRDFLLAQTGVEVYGYGDLDRGGGLDYRLYAGTIFLDVKTQPGNPITLVDLQVPYVVGGRLLWVAPQPLEGLRLGGSVQVLRLDIHLLAPGVAAPILLRIPATLWVASAEYTVRDFVFAAEYSRWLTKTESSNAIFPSSSVTSERAYVLASMRLSPLVQIGAYESLYFPDVDHRGGRETRQSDTAFTVRFDLNRYWLLKLEGHYLHGTASLDSTLNDNVPLRSLKPDWALFAVKTTAYF
jgi:hypothetical protein